MYIVRDIFKLKFGHYREVKPLVDEHFESELVPSGSRVLTDFTGDSYRLIWETPASSMVEYENHLEEEFASSEWKEWYAKFKPHIDSSHREILKQVK